MRILVTGGAGFQGSHLSEKWSRDGHEITVLNTYSRDAERNISSIRGDVSVVWGSVTDREIVDKTVRGHDLVAHLAARINVDDSLEDPRSFLTVNVEGTLNVLEAVRRWGPRMIFASSCEVYGSADGSALTERSELRPHSPYAASKAAADRLCFAYHKSFGLDITVVRPCNIFGERQKSGQGGAVIPIFASLAASGRPLTVFGTGAQRREYMHVKDLTAAYELVLRRQDLSGSSLNAGTGETPSVMEIAEFIARNGGVPIANEPARAGEVAGFSLDTSRIRNLGFTPKVRFWKGLSDYLDNGQAQSSEPR